MAVRSIQAATALLLAATAGFAAWWWILAFQQGLPFSSRSSKLAAAMLILLLLQVTTLVVAALALRLQLPQPALLRYVIIFVAMFGVLLGTAAWGFTPALGAPLAFLFALSALVASRIRMLEGHV